MVGIVPIVKGLDMWDLSTSELTLQVTKKNPLWHTVPIKIITSLILVIKIYFNAKRLLYYNKIIISVEQMKNMRIFVFEIELKKN